MSDPTFAIEKAVLDLLRANAAVTHIVGPRIFDLIGQDTVFPYVELGDGQVVPDPADGFERSVLVTVTLNAYSRKPGRPEVRKLCGAIVAALFEADPDLGPDLALSGFKHDGTRYLVDDDGLTNHGVVTFVASIDPV